ncbi:MAG: hypothetical protein J6A37_03640 [Oscillospiraceae bacterium]|nr:hypothetical protein [Oscillospiraceae bacterium]
MNIRSAIRKITAAVCAASMTFSLSAAVSAAVKDYEFDVSAAPTIDPWASHFIGMDHYDPTKITADSQMIVTYTYEYAVDPAELEKDDSEEAEPMAPVELIVQSWSSPDTPMVNSSGGVWAKVAPAEYDDGRAVFNYADMVAAYGTDDFSDVDALNIGATENIKLTLTSCTLTNCGDDMYIEMTDAERAEAYKNALIIVLASALALIIIIIVVFMVILKRKSSYAYDPTTGKYVKMNK